MRRRLTLLTALGSDVQRREREREREIEWDVELVQVEDRVL